MHRDFGSGNGIRKMLFNLHFTHWSLLFITLISSCFLFYVVASENAKYATTKLTATDATMASAASASPPEASSYASTSSLPHSSVNSADKNAQKISETPDRYKSDQPVNNLPNYEKLKKIEITTQPDDERNINEYRDNNNKNLEENTQNLPLPLYGDSESGEKLSSGSNSKKLNVNENHNDISDNGVISDDANADNKMRNAGTMKRDDNVAARVAAVEGVDNGNFINQQVPESTDSQHKNERVDNIAVNDNTESLPDITDIPTVTITELPLEILQPSQNSLDSVIMAADVASEHGTHVDRVNRTLDITVNHEDEKKKDGQIVKINDSSGVEDSGGGPKQPTHSTTVETQESITFSTPIVNIPNDKKVNDTNSLNVDAFNDSVEQQNMSSYSSETIPASTSSTTDPSATTKQVNLTQEEVPMPVFSEWAQKQMEAAEKQEQQQQEQTFNNSAQRKNQTNGNGKPPSLKIRAKNYASPDCGAKIIASSAYTSNAGAVLSSSKDEYMLSLCGNRIWFVVELCEAIQAQKIDFANFELYSSSPQNFTVAVSKRFPTREWANVGRFVAEDKRAIQGFDLHPHLFGKFVRVDIHSHYSKEHYCTLSLFRVFGTSEFEAFETENHPNEYLDDFDDEDLQEQNNAKTLPEQNLFKSASEAVISIVKKATELVGKPATNQNHTLKTSQQATVMCLTPVFGLFSCAECSASLVERVNNALSCDFVHLNSLLNIQDIRNDLLNTQVCTKRYGIETVRGQGIHKDIRRSFYVNILPNAYVGALCQLLATPKIYQKIGEGNVVTKEDNETAKTSVNQTMDKKFGKEDLELLDKPEKKLIKTEVPIVSGKVIEQSVEERELVSTSTEIPLDENQQQLPRPIERDGEIEVTTAPPKATEAPVIPDKNIFNVPPEEMVPVQSSSPKTILSPEQRIEDTIPPAMTVESKEHTVNNNLPASEETFTTTTTPPHTMPPKSEEDSNSWDNIESLLTSTPTSTMPSGVGSAQPNGGIAAGGFLNQKLSNGGPQTESVFIRLSNRIKALERNMSLSGQYLEELSRRYKKQVEELQQTLTQQIQTVRTLEEQNRRHQELEELYAQRNTQLKYELDDLTLQVHACIVVIIFVGAFVFLVLMVGILLYRSLRRDTKEVLALQDGGRGGKKKIESTSTTSIQKKLNRRKSFEDFSDHQQRREKDSQYCEGGNEKLRRPSEEAMLILKDCKGDGKVQDCQSQGEVSKCVPSAAGRQRKLSVCYASNTNISCNTSGVDTIQTQKSVESNGGAKQRRGEKHSWPNTAQTQLLAKQHLEQLSKEDTSGDARDISTSKLKVLPVGKSKKKKDHLRRQESSPAGIANNVNNAVLPCDLNETDYDEKLLLDDDDLENFLPNADLAYNEFMPEGPRGYQCAIVPPSTPPSNVTSPASKKILFTKSEGSSKKARRLSSPVFFKSPFTKSLKGKITSSKSNPPHESTSWEWYRLKKSSSANGHHSSSCPASNNPPTTNNAFLSVSPNASLDSSSLSEINFPTNCTENSFRILEEAILSSGESAITSTTTGSSVSSRGGGYIKSSGHQRSPNIGAAGDAGENMLLINSRGGISSSSNSNRSSSSNSSSNQSKKKNRSFNKIFRKVF